jgi:hypothetical protein
MNQAVFEWIQSKLPALQDGTHARNDVMLSAIVSSAAEEHEADDQIGGGVGEDAECGRLAGAVRAEQSDDFARCTVNESCERVTRSR